VTTTFSPTKRGGEKGKGKTDVAALVKKEERGGVHLPLQRNEKGGLPHRVKKKGDVQPPWDDARPQKNEMGEAAKDVGRKKKKHFRERKKESCRGRRSKKKRPAFLLRTNVKRERRG